jgi:transketolase N-terminal domain/subunit
MANSTSNSDYRVLCNKIDNLTTQVSKNEKKLDGYHTESQKRNVLAEKQLALMQQSYKVICKDIDENEEDIKILSARQDKNDMWTKIVGGVQGLFTLALTYLGINR